MAILSNLEIRRKLHNLPSLPVVVADLMRSFDDADVGTRTIAEKLTRDLALSAKTLRLANSSFYGLSRKVTTIEQAIAILGFDSVRSLVTAAWIVDAFSSPSGKSSHFVMFWRHSIGTAVCARHLAHATGINQDFAFICGLLHDIGRLVLLSQFAEEYASAVAYRDQHDCFMHEAEEAVLGTDHGMVGSLLAEHWKFPPALQQVLVHHHAPPAVNRVDVTGVVHLADAIAHALDLGGYEDDLVPALPEQVWEAAGLQRAKLHEVIRATESELEETCRMLAA